MSGVVIKLPAQGKRPANLYFCPTCEGEEFLLWTDGSVQCQSCCEEHPHIKVSEK